jgi:hypothetical protein
VRFPAIDAGGDEEFRYSRVEGPATAGRRLVPFVMAVTDWIIAVVAVLALLVSTAALVHSRRAALIARRSQTQARQAAAFAAVVQTAQLRLAEARPDRWRLTRHGAATNDLVNIGDKTAYDVRVEVPAGWDVVRLPTERDEVPSGDAITLGVARSRMASDGGVIRVFWRDVPGGPVREWAHPGV